MNIDPLLSTWGFWLLGLGILFGYLFRFWIGRRQRRSAEGEATQIIKDARSQSEQMKKEAELEIKAAKLQAREVHERELEAKFEETQQLEKRLMTREEGIDKRVATADQRDAEYKRAQQALEDRRRQLEGAEQQSQELLKQARHALERAGQLTIEEAKQELIQSITEEARLEAAKAVRQIDEETRLEAEGRAQKLIAMSIERMAGDSVSERSVSTVQLPNEDMKGRIIGREGRNIRAFEAATGVEVVIDDSADSVTLSCFNPIRREVAKRTLSELLRDGRIQPARIEEIAKKMLKEVEKDIKEAGNQAVMELGLHRMHPELIRYLGILKFRFSYAQNVLNHSIDVGFLCGMMGAELKLNEKMCRRAGLLHDIGKAVTHEIEGAHALIGMDMCKKYGERDDVCHAVGAHHEDIPQETALDSLVDAADALSGARPGARREVLETYMKRLDDLEKLTMSFKGVEKVYAMQAGREIRVMVKHEELNDAQATLLSKDIARKIEHEMTYPGQIRVMVIREMRAVDVAK